MKNMSNLLKKKTFTTPITKEVRFDNYLYVNVSIDL